MSHSVLVVDDEPMVIEALCFLLKRAKFDVRTASDGEMALAEIERNPPDLVLLDVMLPKKSGFEVCAAVRANPLWNDIRIVMLTARDQESEREKGLALGADAYLTKPFSTREVLEHLQSYLESEKLSSRM